MLSLVCVHMAYLCGMKKIPPPPPPPFRFLVTRLVPGTQKRVEAFETVEEHKHQCWGGQTMWPWIQSKGEVPGSLPLPTTVRSYSASQRGRLKLTAAY